MKKPSEFVHIRRAWLEEILEDAKRIERQEEVPGLPTLAEGYARALGACNGMGTGIRIKVEVALGKFQNRMKGAQST